MNTEHACNHPRCDCLEPTVEGCESAPFDPDATSAQDVIDDMRDPGAAGRRAVEKYGEALRRLADG